jgi:hypothetical protein
MKWYIDCCIGRRLVMQDLEVNLHAADVHVTKMDATIFKERQKPCEKS